MKHVSSKNIMAIILVLGMSISMTSQIATSEVHHESAATSLGPEIVQDWDQVFGGSQDDSFASVIPTSDGYLTVGTSNSSVSGEVTAVSRGQSDILLTKFTPAGDLVWDRLIGGSLADVGCSITETPDQGYVIAGYTESGQSGDLSDRNNGGQNALLIKVDQNGNKQWDQIFGGSGYDRFYEVIALNDGGVLAVGESSSSGSGDISRINPGSSSALIAKFDANGKQLWHRLFGGMGADFFSSVIETSDGFAAAGGSYSSATGDLTEMNAGSQDGLFVKFSPEGDCLWARLFGGRAYDEFTALIQIGEGEFAAAGYSVSGKSGKITDSGQGGSDGFLVKFNNSGNVLWNKLFGGAGSDGFHSITMTSDGGMLAVGYSDSASGHVTEPGQGGLDGLMVKFSPTGDPEWHKLVGGAAEDYFSSAAETGTEEFILVGSTLSTSGGTITDMNHGARDGLAVRIARASPPEITVQPGNVEASIDEQVIFYAESSGVPVPAVQWQVKDSDSDQWINLEGQIFNDLTFLAQLRDDGNQYRAVFRNSSGVAYSSAVMLLVHPEGTMDILAGSDRFGTAAAISQASYEAAEYAVLVQSNDFPDALAAGTLAYALRAPILLTKSDQLNDITRAELERLQVKKVLILGGESAVSAAVEHVLAHDMGIQVERLQGADRYLTAVQAADYFSAELGQPTKVILTSGMNPADALSAGSFAAKAGYPILLSNGKTLTSETLEFIVSHSISNIIVTGGITAISDDIVSELTENQINVTRIGGSDRFETSALIAASFNPEAQKAIAANGLVYSDALSAAPYAAMLDAPILLVRKEKIDPVIRTYISAGSIEHVTIVGGTAVIGFGAKQALIDALK